MHFMIRFFGTKKKVKFKNSADTAGWKKIIDKKFSKKVNQEIALSKVFIITSNFFNCISVFPKIFSKRKTDEGKED